MWYKEFNRYLCKIKILLTEKLTNGDLVTPDPGHHESILLSEFIFTPIIKPDKCFHEYPPPPVLISMDPFLCRSFCPKQGVCTCVSIFMHAYIYIKWIYVVKAISICWVISNDAGNHLCKSIWRWNGIWKFNFTRSMYVCNEQMMIWGSCYKLVLQLFAIVTAIKWTICWHCKCPADASYNDKLSLLHVFRWKLKYNRYH